MQTTTRSHPQAVILNDTSGRGHHGCARVMRCLIKGLETRGIAVSARAPAHSDWARDSRFVTALAAADLVVINGEGTLHHGRPAGGRLLDVLQHGARRAPVALINALWQDNPSGWSGALASCALIAARDSRSAEAMRAAQTQVPVRVVPDLSLSQPMLAAGTPRTEVLVGDAVRWSTRGALARTARRLGADALLPTKTLRSRFWRLPGVNTALAALYHGTQPAGLPPMRLARDEADYLRHLANARLHITGRFHGVCLSLVAGAPFLAVTSNSWKVEALLDDAGLGRDRLLPPEELAALTPRDLVRPYNEAETAAIAAYLGAAQSGAARLYDDLVALAVGGRT